MQSLSLARQVYAPINISQFRNTAFYPELFVWTSILNLLFIYKKKVNLLQLAVGWYT